MSFVVKAVKKVFKKVTKFVKRVVRSDWFKVVAIAALAVFTGGLAAGGFGAFSGVSSIGGFFGAVGQTMANGWTAISNFVTGQGFNLGPAGGEALGPAASAAGDAVGSAGSAVETTSAVGGTAADVGIGEVAVDATMRTGGLTDPSILSGVSSSGQPIVSTADMLSNFKAMGGTVAGGSSTNLATGFLSKIGKAFTANNTWGTFMRNATVAGIAGYFEEKDRERQEFYFRNRTVWGGPAFGGTSEGLSLLSPRQRAKSSVFTQTPQQEEAIRQQEQAPTPEQTFGQNNLLAMESPAEQAQRSAQAQIPQPTQPPPTNRPPDRRLLGVPENLGVNYNA